jgi:HEAT repeats
MPTYEPQRKIRVVLRPEAGREDVDDVALDLDWLFLRNFPSSEERPYEDMWIDRDERTYIHYIEDHLVDLRYLVLNGPDADQLRSEVVAVLAVHQPADGPAAWESARSEADRIQAVHLLALTADPDDHAEAAGYLRRAAEDTGVEVRRAVILAATYVGWPELRELLTELAQSDPDPTVVRDARLALEGLDL